MNGVLDPERAGLNDCGCCEGRTAETPVAAANRPGLPAIAYRAGTHSRFLRSMLAELSATGRPALAELRTRDPDDFAVALLDAWATVADVLTFYQERIANESYLRTATERQSLLHLARLIGYELNPGVAAGTRLAFTLEDAPGAPPRTAIDVGAKVQSVPGPGETAQTFETVEPIEARVAWNALKPQTTQPQSITEGLTELYLKGTDTQLQPGDAILIVGPEREETFSSGPWALRLLQSVQPDAVKGHTRVRWAGPLKAGEVQAGATVYALRQRASLFGHNAPDWNSMPDSIKGAYHPDPSTTNEWPGFEMTGNPIHLDAVYPRIIVSGWVVLSMPGFTKLYLAKPGFAQLYRVDAVTSVSRAAFALSAKVTRITADPETGLSKFELRETTVFAQSEELPLTEAPLPGAVADDQVTLSTAVNGLVKGQLLMVRGKDDATEEPVREVVELLAAETADGRTTLTFTTDLQHHYRRDDCAFNANVVRATHGETVEEVLGSGDGSRPYQRFTLRQPLLTYVSAATPGGAESTLRVRVNDVLWHEVPTLYGRGPRERVYVTRTGDDGKTTVQFGDGVTGSRLPTGQENVRARYRKGIGRGGLVKAGQLSLLLTRPLGVREVVNPADATGAQDRETLADARRNAPRTVLTLDRVVSLRDYEDSARTFAGVAKALATWTWEGDERGVFLTVAGPDGAEIPADSDTAENLADELRKAGDPLVPLRIASYRPRTFRLTGKVKVDPDHQGEKVLAAVEEALRDAFSFDARAFGQPVFLSEVLAVIHAVAGIAAVDLDALYVGTTPSLPDPPRLTAEVPVGGAAGEVEAAELLTLDPAPLTGLELLP
jgi:hypothetical protein